MSVTFRDFSNNTTNQHQWIVLDGDIDAGGSSLGWVGWVVQLAIGRPSLKTLPNHLQLAYNQPTPPTTPSQNH